MRELGAGQSPGQQDHALHISGGCLGAAGPRELGKAGLGCGCSLSQPREHPRQCPGLLGEGRGKDGPGDTWGQFPSLPRYWKEGMGQNSFSHLSLCQRTKHPINDKKDMAQTPRSFSGLLSCGEPGRALQTFLWFWENEAALGAREAAAGSTRDIQDCWEMLGQFYFPA